MAANFVIAEPFMGAVPVTQTDSFAQTDGVFLKNRLGIQVRAFDNQTGSVNLGAGVFQYCAGSGAATSAGSGDWVQIIGRTAIPVNSANSESRFPVGIAAGNLSASNVAGWVQIQGLVDYGKCTDSAVVAGNALYLCGTTGLLLSNSVNGNQVFGAVAFTSASSSASRAASYQLNYPRILGSTQAF